MPLRLSPPCERIVRLSEEVSRESGVDYVGTEHLLLAMLREGTSRAIAVLASFGVDEAKIKAELDALFAGKQQEGWALGRPPGSLHVQNVIAKAVEEALRRKAKDVCAEHVLLALLTEEGSAAYVALENLGVTFDGVNANLDEASGA